MLPRRDPQEAAADGPADALGLGDGGELGLAVLVQDDGLPQGARQVVPARVK
jgi:hypothetical protein